MTPACPPRYIMLEGLLASMVQGRRKPGSAQAGEGTAVGDASASDGEPTATNAAPPSERVTASDLFVELDRFRCELRAAGLKEATVQQYLVGASLFVRWVAGDYVPGARRPRRL